MARKARAAKEPLKPYLSAVLLRGSAGTSDEELLSSAMTEARRLIAETAERRAVKTFDAEAGSSTLRLQAHVYRHRRLSPWANQDFHDETHELLVIAAKQGVVAVSCSEAKMRDKLAQQLPGLQPFPREALERAFVGDRANALWLSGVHPITASKATSKALLGPALEYALDPLGDQSFYYSAVRSAVAIDGKATSVGAAPGAGRIWTARKSWSEFAEALDSIIDAAKAALTGPPGRQGWLTLLAGQSGDLADAADPYAIAIVPPELLRDDAIDADEKLKLIDWAYRAGFELTGSDGPSPIARVRLDGREIGTLRLDFEEKAGKFVAIPAWTDEAEGHEDERTQCNALVARPDCLRVYYDGLTLAEGYLFDPAYRDQPFAWRFEDFAGFDVTLEKPRTWGGRQLADVIAARMEDGKDDNSLFAFVVRRLFPKGWLASDDGAMEFADFVHIDPDTHKVTLIHAKGSNIAAAARGVSVSSYEVVVGQAVKNVRHLDRATLASVLKAGELKAIARAVWRDGVKQPNRDGLIALAEQLRPNHEKAVVILQPQLTETEHRACTGQPPTAASQRVKRMKQLDTLMLSARLSCLAVGAEFIGIGAK